MNEEIKNVLMVYSLLVALVIIGHFSENILSTLFFLTMGYFGSFLWRKSKNE